MERTLFLNRDHLFYKLMFHYFAIMNQTCTYIILLLHSFVLCITLYLKKLTFATKKAYRLAFTLDVSSNLRSFCKKIFFFHVWKINLLEIRGQETVSVYSSTRLLRYKQKSAHIYMLFTRTCECLLKIIYISRTKKIYHIRHE